MARLRSPWLRLLLGGTIGAVVILFAGHRLFASATTLERETLTSNAPALGLAFVLLAVSPLFLAAAWIVLLESGAPGPHRRRQLVAAFAYAWIGRYVPGTVPFFAGKLYLGRRAGYANRNVVVSTVVQNLLEVLVSTIVGASLIVAALGLSAGGGRYAALSVVPTMGLAALHPGVLRRVVDVALRALKRDPLPANSLPPARSILAAATLVVANQLVVGIATVLAIGAIAGFSASATLLIMGAMSMAGVAGILVVVAPAGLGVRDGAFVAICAARVAVDAAALGAVVVRALTVVADVGLVLLALAVDAATGRGLILGAIFDDRRAERAAFSARAAAKEHI